jgi:hypothetical protein
MISHEHQCIFIHIPKTAGSSVEYKLGNINIPNLGSQDHRTIRDIEPIYGLRALRLLSRKRAGVSRKHYLPNLLGFGKYVISPELYKNYHKFTIVRNPWERVWSWYKNTMRSSIHGIKPCSFDDFLILHENNWALRPQLWWIVDHFNEIAVNQIIRFENIDTECEKLFRKLGFEDNSLLHLLDGEGALNHYRENYSERARDLVTRRYAREINLFDYKF